jgi:hypothetical protein
MWNINSNKLSYKRWKLKEINSDHNHIDVNPTQKKLPNY